MLDFSRFKMTFTCLNVDGVPMECAGPQSSVQILAVTSEIDITFWICPLSSWGLCFLIYRKSMGTVTNNIRVLISLRST